jgi:hypothetical protein
MVPSFRLHWAQTCTPMRSPGYNRFDHPVRPFPLFPGAYLLVCSMRRILGTVTISSLPSRCLHGMLNGNIGVMKSMLAELTDETNMARGFSLLQVTWAVGGTVGYGTLLTTVPLPDAFDSLGLL